jgi:hypothetical protein
MNSDSVQGEDKTLKVNHKKLSIRGMRKSDFQEELASLYLRLNGYFVSGFIVHGQDNSPQSNRTQVDILALRLPHNSEEEREVGPSEQLQTSSIHTDILICEVKGGKQDLQFNPSLRDDPDAVRSVLRWIGAFEEKKVEELVPRVSDILSPRDLHSPDSFPQIEESEGPVQFLVRAILFAPDRKAPARNQPRYIHGQEILDYIWMCLRPEKPRSECAIRYDFGAWAVYRDLVCYFKELDRKPESLKCIYDHFGLR